MTNIIIKEVSYNTDTCRYVIDCIIDDNKYEVCAKLPIKSGFETFDLTTKEKNGGFELALITLSDEFYNTLMKEVLNKYTTFELTCMTFSDKKLIKEVLKKYTTLELARMTHEVLAHTS